MTRFTMLAKGVVDCGIGICYEMYLTGVFGKCSDK